jgi:GNAT superfamily N-acetyltransferase
MSGEILTDLSTTSQVKAIKGNLYAFFRFMQRAPHAELHSNGALTRWCTPVPHPWFNGVLVSEPLPKKQGSVIQETLDYFKSQNASSLTWWLEPALPVESWRETLLAQGFYYDQNTPGMSLDLQVLRPEAFQVAGLTILPVLDPETLITWVHTFTTGYEIPDAWEDSFYLLMQGLGLDLPMRYYIAYLDGKPVATSNLFLGAGVAGIYCVATLPQARGRGVGAAVTAAPLLEARQLGYRLGVLQSSEMGFPVYQRMGFQHLCQMEHFYYSF